MICQWNKLMAVLPRWISCQLDGQAEQSCSEIRLRVTESPQINLTGNYLSLKGTVSREDLEHVINFSSRYSPWAAITLRQGYLTAPGGHRIGVCGEAVMKESGFQSIRNPRSLCIRVARDFPGLADKLKDIPGSILILGAPGWGKTTLLRDLIRQRGMAGYQVAVMDEREELFPEGFFTGKGIDILSGCPKPEAAEMLLKTMGPHCIAADEITTGEDTLAMVRCAGCGVDLLATVHAVALETLKQKEVLRILLEREIFHTFVILHRDKTWHLERSGKWQSRVSAQH